MKKLFIVAYNEGSDGVYVGNYSEQQQQQQ
jgi:hypothetical protein